MTAQPQQSVFDTLAKHRLIPVIALHDAEQAGPLADALVAGGLPVAEVTFRTDAAAASIREMARRSGMLVGAGTVLSADQVDEACDAGATFVVSPGLNPIVVERCLAIGMPVCPGVATPTEIERSMGFGLSVVKFFPAEALGGVKTLSAIAAPYRAMRFVPTGGVGPENLKDYLLLGPVLACGGSWMVSPSLYEDGDFSKVQRITHHAVQQVAELEKGRTHGEARP
ncbi:MAG: bifunctional 4-hydroxy-2-oxoglutarate aldolase/2-dehydro-3-deoxy-phosphogluconate aldolase [Phycisphaeraceae bacterium]